MWVRVMALAGNECRMNDTQHVTGGGCAVAGRGGMSAGGLGDG